MGESSRSFAPPQTARRDTTAWASRNGSPAPHAPRLMDRPAQHLVRQPGRKVSRLQCRSSPACLLLVFTTCIDSRQAERAFVGTGPLPDAAGTQDDHGSQFRRPSNAPHRTTALPLFAARAHRAHPAPRTTGSYREAPRYPGAWFNECLRGSTGTPQAHGAGLVEGRHHGATAARHARCGRQRRPDRRNGDASNRSPRERMARTHGEDLSHAPRQSQNSR